MENAISPGCPGRRHSQQRGLALLVALIILVVMSLAGIAMVRSIDTGILVAGNLAFRQGSAHAGQRGIEAARRWLLDINKADLSADHPDDGYYASSQVTLDLTGNLTSDPADNVKWEGAAGMSSPKCAPEDGGANTVCYIIHRLCSQSGIALDSSKCTTKEAALRAGSSRGASRQMGTYQQAAWTPTARPYGYYRITVRTLGPRNTISFLQAFVTIAKD